eukprot:TRINITY_DN7570_c0_g2_i1.p1 TRINITY_DN7570_c0_g2~~TRINITY_DN7570_c0_g2_i1.p1  ORF type:complete len:333 (-),score=57.14 TRINITY_DN7570_c0_g2_i1:20-994(-)
MADKPFPFRMIDLRSHFHPALVSHFHAFMAPFFPIADELDPPEVWIEHMNPATSESDLSEMNAYAVFDQKVEEVIPGYPGEPLGKLVGGAVFEYYMLSNTGLMSYLAVDSTYQGAGIAKHLTNSCFKTLQHEGNTRPFPTYPIALPSSVLKFSKLPSERLPAGIESHLERWFGASKCPEGPVPFGVLIAETNAPGVHDGVMDPAQRHAILNKLGYRMLDWDYIQPPLTDGQEPCYDLIMLALRNDQLPEAEGSVGRGVLTLQIKLFMFEFAYTCHQDFSFNDLPYFKQAMSALDSKPELLPLHDLPWSRRTPAPEDEKTEGTDA